MRGTGTFTIRVYNLVRNTADTSSILKGQEAKALTSLLSESKEFSGVTLATSVYQSKSFSIADASSILVDETIRAYTNSLLLRESFCLVTNACLFSDVNET